MQVGLSLQRLGRGLINEPDPKTDDREHQSATPGYKPRSWMSQRRYLMLIAEFRLCFTHVKFQTPALSLPPTVRANYGPLNLCNSDVRRRGVRRRGLRGAGVAIAGRSIVH